MISGLQDVLRLQYLHEHADGHPLVAGNYNLTLLGQALIAAKPPYKYNQIFVLRIIISSHILGNLAAVHTLTFIQQIIFLPTAHTRSRVRVLTSKLQKYHFKKALS